MKLENQVISLEHAKKLKALGVKQESLWWWEEDLECDYVDYRLIYKTKLYYKNRDIYSAYTVAELGELLPDKIIKDHIWINGKVMEKDRRYFLNSGKRGKEHHIKYIPDAGREFKHLFSYTEASARAKMLIYLLENKLVEGTQ